MTQDRLERLLEHCGDLDVEVKWADLGHRRGQYDWRTETITINSQLTRAQAVATLAHEIGHCVFGDHCSSPPRERRAWQYGASLVLTPAEYAAAEALVGCHAGALAAEIGVTPRLIEAWRQWFQRVWPVEQARTLATTEAVEDAE